MNRRRVMWRALVTAGATVAVPVVALAPRAAPLLYRMSPHLTGLSYNPATGRITGPLQLESVSIVRTPLTSAQRIVIR